jgi:GNAT superfamily N-acetyltransferase
MIRLATIDDIPDIIALGERLVRQGAYAQTQVNFLSCANRLTRALRDPDEWLGVAEHRGRVVGFLILQVVRHWWSGTDCVVLDDGIYCTRPGLGRALVRAGEQWAWSRIGVREVLIALTSNVGTARSARVLARLGYTDRGVVVSKAKPIAEARRWAA